MRKSNLEKLRDAKRAKAEPLTLDFDGLLKLLLGGDFNPTQRAFIYDSARIKAYKGPAGCAKTSTLCASGLARALLQPGSKGLVARYDYNDLTDTTALRMEEMLHRLPRGVLLDRDKSPPMKWWLQPAVKDAEPSQVTFMGLKESLGSYEFNWAIVDEADEVDERRVHEINTRLRNPGGDYSLAVAFNPPDKHHWLYTACTGRNFQDKITGEPWMKLFEPEARENQRNLPQDYYEQLTRQLPEDMRARLVRGEWGATFDGQAVYREFNPAFHVRDDLATKFDPARPLIRMWDFGYNRPACIWGQVDWEGKLLCFYEILGERQEAREFGQRCKAETALRFPHADTIVDYGDPAVRQKKDTGSTLVALANVGIHILFKIRGPGSVNHGVRLVRNALTTTIAGEPQLQFDRKGVPVLISAMRGGYRLEKLRSTGGKVAEGTSGPDPFKDGYYEHICLAPKTRIETPDGARCLDSMRPGDVVVSASPDGPTVGEVVWAGLTDPAAKRFELDVAGRKIIATGNHPVLTQRGWVAVDSLRYGDYIVTHESNRAGTSLSAIQRQEVLQTERQVLFGGDWLQQTRGASSGCVVCGSRRDSAKIPHTPRERELRRQSLGELGTNCGERAYETTYVDARTQGSVSNEYCEVCNTGGSKLALNFRGAGVALEEREGRLGKKKALREAMFYLRQELSDALSTTRKILRAELQGGRFSATASWVRKEVLQGPVYNLTVTPIPNFIANGVVVHNCDAFRYGVDNLFSGGQTGKQVLHPGSLPESVAYGHSTQWN